MGNAKLKTILENLLRQGYSEYEIINQIRSISATIALERWEKESKKNKLSKVI